MNSSLVIHSPESAPQSARDTLRRVSHAYGFLPNLLGALANAPTALHAYLGLAEQFAQGSLSPAEQQVVSLSVSREHQCGYCMAAHSVLAGKALPAAQIAALRAGDPTGDARLDGLAHFTRKLVEQRGGLDGTDLAAFEAAGFQRAQALEVLVGVAQKILSNYANHLLDTPLDPAFEAARWQPAQRSAA